MSRRVHLVDSDPALPALLAPVLVGHGFHPVLLPMARAADHAADPGAWIVRLAPDPVGGLALIQAIRQADATAPILALVAPDQVGLPALASLWGADHCMTLPALPGALVAALHEIRVTQVGQPLRRTG